MIENSPKLKFVKSAAVVLKVFKIPKEPNLTKHQTSPQSVLSSPNT
jgi:hypothetical protein